MLKTAFNAYLVSIALSFSSYIQAREVTAIIVSFPSGATIYDHVQAKPKVLGKAPLRITFEVGTIDYQGGVLPAAERYSAKWPSGAISKVFSYKTPVSETEFVYFVERPLSVAGETKDRAAGDAHSKKPEVAAENQAIAAKLRQWDERLASYKKQKEYESQVEELARQRAAAEAQQRAQQQAANEAQAFRTEQLRAQQQKDVERAAQERANLRLNCLPVWSQREGGIVPNPNCR